MSDFDHFCFNKTEFNVVLLHNFKIMFYDKHFENTQVKHNIWLVSFETQCNDSNIVDKLFKSAFISWRLKKMLQKVISKVLL